MPQIRERLNSSSLGTLAMSCGAILDDGARSSSQGNRRGGTEEKRAEERTKLREKVAEMAAEAGFSLDEVVSKRGKDRRRGKAAVKYRNPEDRSQTWTGRGRKPNWLIAELEAGRSIDEFAV